MTQQSKERLAIQVLSDTEIEMSRTFDAPRALVWRAYTEPELVARWWGQRDSTTIVEKMDVRVGGQWRYIERAADGSEYAFRGEYLEVTPIERLSNTFEFEPMAGHISTDVAIFEDLGNRTNHPV